jgi:hypothetical protein
MPWEKKTVGFQKVNEFLSLKRFEESEKVFWEEWWECLENRCIHCCSRIIQREYQCSRCGARFWQPIQLFKRMLVSPWLGYRSIGRSNLAFMFQAIDLTLFTAAVSSMVRRNLDFLVIVFVVGIIRVSHAVWTYFYLKRRLLSV